MRGHAIPKQSDPCFTFTIGDESFEVVEFTLQEGLSETFLLHVDLASAHSSICSSTGRLGDEPVQHDPTPGGDQPQPALRRFAYTENVRTARQTRRDFTFHNRSSVTAMALASDLFVTCWLKRIASV